VASIGCDPLRFTRLSFRIDYLRVGQKKLTAPQGQ
jgi:hypothetical protein